MPLRKNAGVPQFYTSAHSPPIVPSQNDPVALESFRPISLTNCSSKLVENIINEWIQWCNETQNLLQPNLSIFHSGCIVDSVTDFFLLVWSTKNKTKCHSCHIRGHQTGIRHGLSRACHQRLSVILSLIGKTLRVMNNFLTRRRMSVAISKVKALEHKVKHGVPQGSFLSYALFNAVLVQLPRWLSPNICCSIDARDICSLTSGQPLQIIEIALKVAFNQVN